MSSRGRPPRGSAPQSDSEVARLRNRLGLTQELFAKKMGIAASTVRQWESGRRHPSGPASALLGIMGLLVDRFGPGEVQYFLSLAWMAEGEPNCFEGT